MSLVFWISVVVEIVGGWITRETITAVRQALRLLHDDQKQQETALGISTLSPFRPFCTCSYLV